MSHIHYPVSLQTTQGQGEVEDSFYTKSSHSVKCENLGNADKEIEKNIIEKYKPRAPYFWRGNVTCRDWKMRYCCENLWGEPSLYDIVARNSEKPVPDYINRTTDVFVDPPTRKTLFDDCEWGKFVRFEQIF